MSSLASRLAAPRVSTRQMQKLFAQTKSELTDAPNDFGFGADATRRMQLAQQAGDGLVEGVNGNIGDAISDGLTQEEKNRRLRNIRTIGEANIISTIDAQIAEIDFQIQQTQKEIDKILARLKAKYGDIIEERVTITGDIEAIEAAQKAEEELALAEAEKLAAEERLANARSADEAIRCHEDIAAADGRIEIAAEELERREGILRDRAIDPAEMNARLEDLQGRLDAIDEILANDPDGVRLAELEVQLEDLTARRDTLTKLKKQYEANPDQYSNYGELIDSMPDEEQAGISSMIDRVISSPRWEAIEAKITGAVDAVIDVANDAVETVTTTVNDTITTVSETVDAAVDTVSDLASGAVDGITSLVSSDDQPTGDRVGTTAAKADGQGITGATPPTTQHQWQAAVTPDLGTHPAQERQFVPAPAPEVRI